MKIIYLVFLFFLICLTGIQAQDINTQNIESNSFEVMANIGYLWNDVSHLEYGGEVCYKYKKNEEQGWLIGLGAHRAQNRRQQRFQTRGHLEAGFFVNRAVILSGYGNLIFAQDQVLGEKRNYFRPEVGISLPFTTYLRSQTNLVLRLKGKYGYDFGNRFYANPPHNFTISLCAGLEFKQVSVR